MTSKRKHPFPEKQQPFSVEPDAKGALTISSAAPHSVAFCDLIIKDSTLRLASQTVADTVAV